MKRKVMTMFVLMAVAACSKPSTDLGTENPGPGGQEPAPAIEYEYTLMGVCGTIDTRIGVGEAVAGRQPFTWDSRDKISLFGSDDALLANLTLSEGQGTAQGKFFLKTTEEVTAPVRAVYPYGKNGIGLLSDLQELDGSNLADMKGRCNFYTEPINLIAGGTTMFELKSALALIRLDILCAGVEGDVSLTKIEVSRYGAALSGEYQVDYQTGVVTPGAEVSDNVTVSFYNTSPLVSQAVCPVWISVLPSAENLEYTMKITVVTPEKTEVLERTFTAVLSSSAVNVVDMTDINLGSYSTGNAGSFGENIIEPIK